MDLPLAQRSVQALGDPHGRRALKRISRYVSAAVFELRKCYADAIPPDPPSSASLADVHGMPPQMSLCSLLRYQSNIPLELDKIPAYPVSLQDKPFSGRHRTPPPLGGTYVAMMTTWTHPAQLYSCHLGVWTLGLVRTIAKSLNSPSCLGGHNRVWRLIAKN